MTAELSAESHSAGQVRLNFLPKPLVEPVRPVRALLVAWLTAFIPSIALAAAVGTLLPDARTPEFPISGIVAIILLVFFAPIVETLIMGSVLLILLRFVSATSAVLVSAFGWAVAHSLSAPIWGLIIWWPFLVFSTLFVTWRSRSVAVAFAMAAAVHALHNLPPALLVASGQIS